MKPDLKPRTRSYEHKINQNEFNSRFHQLFLDPSFDSHRDAIQTLSEIAWENYRDGKKAPITSPAGPNYQDPAYQLSQDWTQARDAIHAAQKEHESGHPRALLIMASDRNEGTCPGEYSKTSRLAEIAQSTLLSQQIEVEILDLSLMTVEYGKTIYPCKGCVSTAMPLCHWPCSCYPHHSLGQVNDWMNEIYPKWVRAHGIMIITPVYWHQAPSCLKLMIDRLVCADGGNPDPTTTQGKKAELAKKIEMQGWSYPRHLKDRVFSVIVHGDVTGAEELKNALVSWLEEMELISAGSVSQLARYIGYFKPYATSHQDLDEDQDIQIEVKNAALNLGALLKTQQQRGLKQLFPHLQNPRPK